MESTIATGLSLMRDGQIRESIKKTLLSNVPEVDELNSLFNHKWCLSIIDTGTTLDEREYVLQVRLFIDGMGFRDGIGTGANVYQAKLSALKDAMLLFGIVDEDN